VIAIFTARDVPVNEYGLTRLTSRCCAAGSQAVCGRVRFIGDQVALVVAETEEIAAEARDLIVVEYEDLPVVTDVLEAMKQATCLHRSESNIFANTASEKEMWKQALPERM
jgi:CO/xanthine dehydrogenase Mo-binding subunit